MSNRITASWSFCLLLVCLLGASIYGATTVKTVALNAYDVVYDPFSQRLYASVASDDVNYGNSIAVINPVTGVVEKSVFVGSDPRKLAISADGEYIYVGLYGAGSVSRFHVPSQTVDNTFSLGTGSYGTTYAEDISVQPGNSNVIAVSRYRKGVSPRHDGVAIYDNGVKRPQGTPDHTGANVIEFSDSPQIVYGYNNETTEFAVRTMVVNEYGITTSKTTSGLFGSFSVDFEYADGYMYSTNGRVVNTATMQLAGQFNNSGMVEPDATVRRTFMINGATISAYNQKTFLSTGQYTVAGSSISARNLIRWGANGLAFASSNKVVYILQTDLVPNPPVLTSLVVEGPSHLAGYKGQYKLIATFDDGVVADVTQKSRWSIEPDTYTSIDNTGTLYVFGTDQAGATTVHTEYMFAGTLYTASKEITFDGVIPAVGNLVRLQIDGPRQVLQESSVQMTATAFFDDGTQYDVTNKVIWQLGISEFADISETGLLTIGQIDRPRDIILYAYFGYKDVELDTNKTVIVLEDASQMSSSEWATYQGNPQRTGYAAVALDPEEFSLRWTKTISGLKPVSAAAGRVFVGTASALSCLDARDGESLWSVSDYCQHQPTYAYGNVYLQVGRHSSSAPTPYLKAYDADTGAAVFASSFSQQWSTWYAPAVYDGSVYIGGGYYGGMYGFNAFSGAQQWSRSLPQVDNWTPAVQGDYSYAYVSGTLYATDRYYGTEAFTIKAGSGTQVPVLGGFNNAVVSSGSALYCLDLVNKNIRWQAVGSYSGMPSVAEGVVYAVNNGVLAAHDEATGNLLWSWTAPEGKLRSPMIVTQTHVIACTEANTYSIEILGRASDWSYPASGSLALGNDTLYIASSNGLLTAIATPEYIPAVPVKLEIQGPDTVLESSTTAYQAIVTYSDGRIRGRTSLCTWAVAGKSIAVLDTNGSLSAGELLYPQEKIVLSAEYRQDDSVLSISKPVAVRIGCSVDALLERNIAGAIKRKQTIMLELREALAREQATIDILKNTQKYPMDTMSGINRAKARYYTEFAFYRERSAKNAVYETLGYLDKVLGYLDPQSAFVQDQAMFMKAYSSSEQP